MMSIYILKIHFFFQKRIYNEINNLQQSLKPNYKICKWQIKTKENKKTDKPPCVTARSVKYASYRKKCNSALSLLGI